MVAIPLFLFVFVSIEFARALMAVQSMEEAARSGAREAVLKGATAESVEAEVAEMMSMLGLTDGEYSVEINPSDLSSANRWTPISVTIGTTFDQLSWLPAPMYLKEIPLSASCVLPREASPET